MRWRWWTNLRKLLKSFRRPVKIPGKFPWATPVAGVPAYGTPLFEDANQQHFADGIGGIVSLAKHRLSRPQRPGTAPWRGRRRPF